MNEDDDGWTRRLTAQWISLVASKRPSTSRLGTDSGRDSSARRSLAAALLSVFRKGLSLTQLVSQAALVQQLSQARRLILLYERPEAQDAAREVIPIERLHDEARSWMDSAKARNDDSNINTGNNNVKSDDKTGSEGDRQRDVSFEEGLVRALLKWFKRDFFRWTDAPPCDRCQGPTSLWRPAHSQPTPLEESFLASIVEVYDCTSCSVRTRFPRFNDPVKLLETRQGRCGEWANVWNLSLSFYC
jgi:peptide-N4-(N-acetyl-beta-glucosaminyl)asparagine amidase